MAILEMGLGWGGCDKLSKKNDAQATMAGRGTGGPVPVLVATAVQQDMPLQIQAIGWSESYQSVRVKLARRRASDPDTLQRGPEHQNGGPSLQRRSAGV